MHFQITVTSFSLLSFHFTTCVCGEKPASSCLLLPAHQNARHRPLSKVQSAIKHHHQPRASSHNTTPTIKPYHLPSSSSSHPNTNHNNHLAHHADQVNTSLAPHLPKSKSATKLTNPPRVRTLTGKEIELDIEPDYKVRPHERKQQNAQYMLQDG